MLFFFLSDQHGSRGLSGYFRGFDHVLEASPRDVKNHIVESRNSFGIPVFRFIFLNVWRVEKAGRQSLPKLPECEK